MTAPVPAADPTILGVPADDITAAFTCILAIATIGLVLVASFQIPLLTKQIKLAREADEKTARRQIEANTIRACERYISDGVIYQATRRIWDASDQGTDYSITKVDEHDLIVVLNYLDGIAIGVKQGVFSGLIVKDHLGSSFIKIVDVVVPKTFGNFKDYEAIEELRDSWKEPVSVAYKANKTAA